MIDTYSYKARVLPVYFTLAPVVLLVATFVPAGLKLPLGSAAALVFIPISVFLSQAGADFGKRLEKRLWQEWDGPPTTRFLRHGNAEFNEATRRRVHEKLRALKLIVPTPEGQAKDRRTADTYLESCTEELIRRTRDRRKFPLVFKGLTDYGLRRNLLGLKPFGMAIALVGCVASGLASYERWPVADEHFDVAIVSGLICAALLFTWVSWVTKEGVKMMAERYARFLLEAALDLQ